MVKASNSLEEDSLEGDSLTFYQKWYDAFFPGEDSLFEQLRHEGNLSPEALQKLIPENLTEQELLELAIQESLGAAQVEENVRQERRALYTAYKNITLFFSLGPMPLWWARGFYMINVRPCGGALASTGSTRPSCPGKKIVLLSLHAHANLTMTTRRPLLDITIN